MPSTAAWTVTGGLEDHRRWRPEWSGERQCLYWYLAFDEDRLATALGRPLLDAVAEVDWLDPVPPRWMHLSLCEVGYVDELSDDAAARVSAEALRTFEDSPPLRLRLGPLATHGSALALNAGPSPVLADLRERARRAVEAAVGPVRERVDAEPFDPHVTVGYVNRDVDLPVVESTVRALPPVRTDVDVDRLTLATVTRRDKHYQWQVDAEVDLPRHARVDA
jgi:2'-5' RNA ligase